MAVPWTEVNEAAPARVADVLDLPRSPVGGRKRCCPFCGGRNFAPLKRAFYCYSGCGGRAYSNVDTAAAHWGTDPLEACRRLAELLGIAFSGADPPWAEVAGHPTPEVAAVLGLRQAEERWRWDCPVCAGNGTLRSYRYRWRCSGTPCAGDEHRGWKGHVDLAMSVWRTTPADACFRLAAALRGAPPPPVRSPSRPAEPEEPGPREAALASIRARPGAREPEAFYRLLLDHLRLGPLGRDELLRRRIDPEPAERFGFRSAEPGEWEKRILPLMAAFADDELLAAGFPRPSPVDEGDASRPVRRPWWPGWGRAPLLLIPVWDGARLSGVYFRNLGDPAHTRCPRYIAPKDALPDAPFNAAALEGDAHTLLIIEGYLNAYVAAGDPYRAAAIGIPGAWTWQDGWALRILDTTRFIVGVFDDDDAGRKGAARVRDSIARVRGTDWARARWRRLLLDLDLCELHQAHRLAAVLRQAPWITQDTEPLWAEADGATDALHLPLDPR